MLIEAAVAAEQLRYLAHGRADIEEGGMPMNRDSRLRLFSKPGQSAHIRLTPFGGADELSSAGAGALAVSVTQLTIAVRANLCMVNYRRLSNSRIYSAGEPLPSHRVRFSWNPLSRRATQQQSPIVPGLILPTRGVAHTAPRLSEHSVGMTPIKQKRRARNGAVTVPVEIQMPPVLKDEYDGAAKASGVSRSLYFELLAQQLRDSAGCLPVLAPTLDIEQGAHISAA